MTSVFLLYRGTLVITLYSAPVPEAGAIFKQRICEMMKPVSVLLTALLFSCVTTPVQATTVAGELERVAGEVAGLKLGFGSYVLGTSLTEQQKETADQNRIMKALQGTYKFQDGEIYVVVGEENDVVLGVYKSYPEASMEQVKDVVGGLMLEFGEPTAMAHDKLIYWAFDKNGRIPQDVFDFSRQSGGTNTLATVKFSSSKQIRPETSTAENVKQDEIAPEKKQSIYVMITSDPLSKLFLAYTNPQISRSEK